MVSKHDQSVDSRGSETPQEFEHPAARATALDLTLFQAYHDVLVAGQVLSTLHLELQVEVGIEGTEPSIPFLVHLERAHEGAPRPTDDAYHRRFGKPSTPRAAPPLGARQHEVPSQRP